MSRLLGANGAPLLEGLPGNDFSGGVPLGQPQQAGIIKEMGGRQVMMPMAAIGEIHNEVLERIVNTFMGLLREVIRPEFMFTDEELETKAKEALAQLERQGSEVLEGSTDQAPPTEAVAT